MFPRRLAILAITAAVVGLCALPATATHTGTSCSHSSVVVVGDRFMPECSMTLTCPSAAGHTCKWTMSVAASGVGYVAGRVFVPGQGLPWVYCTGVLSCSAATPGYTVGAGLSKVVHCRGGDVAVNDFVSCTAQPTS